MNLHPTKYWRRNGISQSLAVIILPPELVKLLLNKVAYALALFSMHLIVRMIILFLDLVYANMSI